MQSATRSVESVVIGAPLEDVWATIRPLDLSSFWSAVKSSKVEGGAPDQVGGSTRTVEYKDGSNQVIRLVELSDLTPSLSWELVTATPAPSYLGANHTITLHRVTADNSTFVSWTTEFSSAGDQALAVVEDSKYKKKEALGDLKAKLEKK
ncbi:hypothetical protein DFJ74DRAFT_692209 [Hyaloraphidium curvatum]|nr:hypothetical protein DFJ74DRAFT_692209 [Hyaloraphidium curvatum]